ncbi:hypothetical protein SteCoe_113 [Stentor coeruleus]|uniref:Uncharacterized protein n=1 Tax=Stentor coeruleus TaxID=5963 RepID=A0A1R2D525_9CILI|nr:hypothetical protein SteCoe_113 [Stentor coeruleus]
MGCKGCKAVEKNEGEVFHHILKYIQTEDISSLHFYLQILTRRSKDHYTVIMNEKSLIHGAYKLNFLAFSLIVGATKSFKMFYEKCRCCLELMNQNFFEYGLDPLNIICEKGHLELLKYYLPLYMQFRNIICEKGHLELLKYYLPLYMQFRSSNHEANNTTLQFQTNIPMNQPRDSYTPMQVACISGHIGIVDHLYQFNKSFPDPLLDISEINEETGENCAIISVRSGSLPIVKMMREKYSLDFHVKNKFGESALQICAICSTHFPNTPYSDIFAYLVDEVGLDLTENHEEILLVIENKEMIAFTENKLRGKGISVSKKELVEIFTNKKKARINNVLPNINLNVIKRADEPNCSCISSIDLESSETPFLISSFLNVRSEASHN